MQNDGSIWVFKIPTRYSTAFHQFLLNVHLSLTDCRINLIMQSELNYSYFASRLFASSGTAALSVGVFRDVQH